MLPSGPHCSHCQECSHHPYHQLLAQFSKLPRENLNENSWNLRETQCQKYKTETKFHECYAGIGSQDALEHLPETKFDSIRTALLSLDNKTRFLLSPIWYISGTGSSWNLFRMVLDVAGALRFSHCQNRWSPEGCLLLLTPHFDPQH